MNVAEFIQKINTLPTPSPVLTRIGAVVADENSSADDLLDVLKLDPAICSKVLRLANSAYIGLPRTVSSLHNAVVILGQQRVHSLVVASGALSSLSRQAPQSFDIVAYWRHSITVAMVAESIGRHLKRYHAIEAGEVFCAGILHDIGKLALGTFAGDILERTHAQAAANDTPFFANEERDTSHTEIGFLLARRWGFPDSLAGSIRFHHAPASAGAFAKTAAIVHLSDIMVHMLGFKTLPDEKTPDLDDNVVSGIGLQLERLHVIARDAIENEKRVESLIDFIS